MYWAGQPYVLIKEIIKINNCIGSNRMNRCIGQKIVIQSAILSITSLVFIIVYFKSPMHFRGSRKSFSLVLCQVISLLLLTGPSPNINMSEWYKWKSHIVRRGEMPIILTVMGTRKVYGFFLTSGTYQSRREYS